MNRKLAPIERQIAKLCKLLDLTKKRFAEEIGMDISSLYRASVSAVKNSRLDYHVGNAIAASKAGFCKEMVLQVLRNPNIDVLFEHVKTCKECWVQFDMLVAKAELSRHQSSQLKKPITRGRLAGPPGTGFVDAGK